MSVRDYKNEGSSERCFFFVCFFFDLIYSMTGLQGMYLLYRLKYCRHKVMTWLTLPRLALLRTQFISAKKLNGLF